MSFRPKTFDDLLGQEDAKETLKIAIASANKRGDALGHVLIEAQSGTGKSTFAGVIANELGVNIRVILGSNISSFKDLLPSLLKLKKREILFIDEIHTVTKKIAESLYTVLEDFRIDLSDSKKTQDIETFKLPKFTMIGATTESGLMPTPLRNRFKLQVALSLYNEKDITKIIKSNAERLKMNLSEAGAMRLAKASRGVPRTANALLEWSRDYGIAKGINRLREDDVSASLSIIGIGPEGSSKEDRRYLDFLKTQSDPVGLDTIAASTGLNRDTILNVIEPFLLRRQIIIKTSKGRKIV